MTTRGEITSASEYRVLVVIMNNQRDFEIARSAGWYRIPVKRAPRQIAADYLAFYQTAAFPEERWSINYYAPVIRYRLVTRRELLPEESDHPRANDPYYKIEIGPLRRLPRSIPSMRLRRITFIPTTLDRLMTAQEINDLWEKSSTAERLWREFKRHDIEAEREYVIRDGSVAYNVDFAIFCRQGNIAIECGDTLEKGTRATNQDRHRWLTGQGWSILQFTHRQVWRALPSCISAVRAQIEQHGGLLPCDPLTSPS